MKRSEINQRIREAERLFQDAGLFLPEWAHWTPEEWKANAERCHEIAAAGLGWDLTDFGRREYRDTGLLLFTVRNGYQGAANPITYAEKLMVVLENQVTPMHFHWNKTEDIINRGGGELVLELHMARRGTEDLSAEPFTVYRDGLRLDCAPGQEVRLAPGQSITLYPWLYHTFHAEGATCIVGEVSSVNDDTADNRFLESIGRFPEIDEDEPPHRLLCIDYGRLAG